MLALPLDQVMPRPVRMVPLMSRATAVAVVVAPASASVGLPSVTAMVAMGDARTEIGAVPSTPSTLAVICAVPGPTAVTTPVDDTVTMAGLDDDQVTV